MTEQPGRGQRLRIVIEFDAEDDGRVIADVVSHPGIMAYGRDRPEALRNAAALLAFAMIGKEHPR